MSHLATDTRLPFVVARRAAVDVSFNNYRVIGRQLIAIDRWELSTAKMLLEDSSRCGISLLVERAGIARVGVMTIFR